MERFLSKGIILSDIIEYNNCDNCCLLRFFSFSNQYVIVFIMADMVNSTM